MTKDTADMKLNMNKYVNIKHFMRDKRLNVYT